jgi:hypothetical protein
VHTLGARKYVTVYAHSLETLYETSSCASMLSLCPSAQAMVCVPAGPLLCCWRLRPERKAWSVPLPAPCVHACAPHWSCRTGRWSVAVALRGSKILQCGYDGSATTTVLEPYHLVTSLYHRPEHDLIITVDKMNVVRSWCRRALTHVLPCESASLWLLFQYRYVTPPETCGDTLLFLDYPNGRCLQLRYESYDQRGAPLSPACWRSGDQSTARAGKRQS